MKIKPGARVLTVDQAMTIAYIAADRIWTKYGQTLVLTTGADGTHSTGSLHYTGCAADFRTNYFSAERKRLVAEELRESLGPDYDVASEASHIHCEWQPKKGLNL